MGDLATLLAAAGSFLAGIGAIVGAGVQATRTSSRERHRASRKATRKILESAADGQVTPEEAADALRELYGEADDE